jgi:Na+/glutamate symporter
MNAPAIILGLATLALAAGWLIGTALANWHRGRCRRLETERDFWKGEALHAMRDEQEALGLANYWREESCEQAEIIIRLAAKMQERGR